jgi:hypothetical protein
MGKRVNIEDEGKIRIQEDQILNARGNMNGKNCSNHTAP